MNPVRHNFSTSLLLLLSLLIPVIAFSAERSGNRPHIPILKARELATRCEDGLDDLRAMVKKLEAPVAGKRSSSSLVFKEWNALQIALEDLHGPVGLLNHVSPNPAVRKSAEPCQISITKFATDLFQNAKLYNKIKATQPTDAIEKKLKQDILDSFDDTGVSLPPEKQKRMKKILVRLTELKQTFARNIRDNPQKLSFTPEEMQGLPENFLAKAKRDAKGNYQLGFDYTDYMPFMQSANSSDARKRYQFAFVNRGTPKNLALMKEAIALRQEMAQLFGFNNYAEFVLRRRMAGKPDAVNGFLADVQTAVTDLEKQELADMRIFKSRALGTPLEETVIERWDIAYWQEKMKQAIHHIDQNALRKYFPTQASVKWVMAMSGILYGVQFKPAKVPLWHKDVTYYDIYDSKTLARIGGIYFDLFPRKGKYGHAAVFGVRGSSTLAKRTPISVMVANFNREGLDSNELETLLHEFGHLMHGALSKTRFVDHAGTSVEQDFVEAPSQMFEEWARRKETLAMIPQFCTTPCPQVDNDLLLRLKAAHHFGLGNRYARQHLYATFDMALHQSDESDPLTTWQKMEGATPLGYVKGTEFPGQFNHLMGGYAAGYYGYMWSEVLAMDMVSRFGDNLMNTDIGMLYRKTILERGGELRGRALVRSFLGREPSSQAFFNEISGVPASLSKP
ncbi:MAG: Zn-dependent oligopeptidase [Oxalobacter sp.]|nr:MAG: Zn-dependent oligopeptidase [Oxalobacter sp.]